MRVRQVCIGALLALAWCLPAQVQARTLQMEYDGAAYGVIQLGRARIEATVSGATYAARGDLETAGLAALFSDARAIGASTGDQAPFPLRARTYSLDHAYRGEKRTWLVDWSQAPVAVATAPGNPFQTEVPPTEAQRREGRDPLSTILAMGAHITQTGRCDGVFRVFDGLYVYDMTMRSAGNGRYRRRGIDLPVVKCALRQQRVAGYRFRADLEKKLPEAEIWFGTPPGAPFAVLARFSSRLPLGVATISLTSYGER